MKVINAKFLNEFYKLVDKYDPDKEINELAKKSSEMMDKIGDNENLIAMSSTLMRLTASAGKDGKRKTQLIEFNCKAYSMIFDKPLSEVQEMDYKEVLSEVDKFRSDNS
jgi:hypothetical protein